jgi:hypothetical protein
MWLLALEQYLNAYNFGITDPEIIDKIGQAAYYAASDPDSEGILFEDHGEQPGEIERAVQARYLAWHRDHQAGLEMIGAVLGDYPDSYIGRLVLAETLGQVDRVDEAMAVLDDLLGEDGTPAWIKVEARRIQSMY